MHSTAIYNRVGKSQKHNTEENRSRWRFYIFSCKHTKNKTLMCILYPYNKKTNPKSWCWRQEQAIKKKQVLQKVGQGTGVSREEFIFSSLCFMPNLHFCLYLFSPNWNMTIKSGSLSVSSLEYFFIPCKYPFVSSQCLWKHI